MAVPKKRTSKSAKGQRRSHDALKAVTTGLCSNCNQPVRPHRACTNCGYYNGKKVLAV